MSPRKSWSTVATARKIGILVVSVATAFGVVACAAGSGTGSEAGAIEIWFPPAGGLVTVDSLTVRGGSSDPSMIAAVRVNGVLATTTSGFAEWEAEIPLAPGANPVIVKGEYVDGRVVTVATVTITRTTTFDLWEGVGAAVMDPYAPRALVLEELSRDLSFLDLETGAREKVLDGWEAPALRSALGVALDIHGNRLWVVEDGLYEIDLETGARTVVSNADRGSGAPLRWPFMLAYDQENGRVVMLEKQSLMEGPYAIVAVDLSTGDRTVLSDNGHGAGVELIEPNDLALDPWGVIAYVLDPGQESLLSVDLLTGARTVIASGLAIERPSQWGDPEIYLMRSNLELDAENHRALVMQGASGELQAIDLSTGERTIVAADVAPAERWRVDGFMFDGPLNRVIFHVHDTFRALDLTTGEQQRLSTTYVGDGPPLSEPAGVTLNRAGDRAYVTVHRDGDIAGGVLEVDLTTGNRRVATGRGEVTESEYGILDSLRSIVLDEEDGRLLMNSDWRGEVVAVALDTGETDVLWDAKAAFPDADHAAVKDLASYGDELLVVTRFEPSYDPGDDVVCTIALDSDAWETSSGIGTGVGPALSALTSIVTSHEDGLAFVGDASSCSVLGIDLATGNRYLIFQSYYPYDCHYDVYAYDHVRGRLVTNFSRTGGGGIHLIDTATGRITEAAMDGGVQGYRYFRDLTLDRHGYSLIGIDEHLLALIAIDPSSGGMVVLSR